MINYYIPDFFWHFNVNLRLLELMREESEIFYDDFKIGAVFGNFPNCIWNGGSYFSGRFVDQGEMLDILARFNLHGVPLRLTMTNPLITKDHLNDTYSNYIMRNIENGFNQVLVCSPILEAHIRENYPTYPIVRSILAAENIYYDDSDKYFMSVLRKHKNNDLKFLKQIKNKDKIEILVNETCEENCPRAYTHYLEYAQKTLLEKESNELNMKCSYDRKWEFKKFHESSLCLTRDKIKNIYEPMGFKHFKLSGRGSHGKIVIWYAHYMVKPEYKEDFINLMFDSICQDN